MELRHLRYVLAAAEAGSFRAAARALGIRESAVSRRIRDLEDEIGAALFVRSHKGVKLTYAGQRFVCRSRTALDQISDATKDVGAIGRATGSKTELLRTLAAAASVESAAIGVRSFIPKWRARNDSNTQPSDP